MGCDCYENQRIFIGNWGNNERDIRLLSNKTRDLEIDVYQDCVSRVIFLDNEFDICNYHDSSYRKNPSLPTYTGHRTYEDITDNMRRVAFVKKWCAGKRLLDFGCGEGTFLRNIKDISTVSGVELEIASRRKLTSEGVTVFDNISSSPDIYDVITMFHSLEHLNDPIDILKKCYAKLVQGGRLIIEVPHARDILIECLESKEFLDFTLWSQHLVLHTRKSLDLLLKYCGFVNINILGWQRYSLGNHIGWVRNGIPGGHKSDLGILDDDNLTSAYQSVLASLDLTDTLVAVCEKP